MLTINKTNLMPKSIDKELLAALKYSGLDKSNLSEIVKILSGFKERGLRPTKVFPYGIPYPDGVRVHVSLDANQLGSLVDILKKGARIDKLEVFPKGIPFPDIFQVEIGIR